VKTLCIAIATLLLQACSSLTRPSPANPSPLVVANCPQLAPLSDDTLGAYQAKLVEVGQQYRDCRAAALAK
jgi:outer membrane biogenesis lipoprotein LolB